jgi:hypothetical protein
LPEGKTIQDLIQALQGESPPTWAVLAGGPNSPRPQGGVSEAIVTLQPGRYAALCVIPSPDGTPHVAKGMLKTVTVIPAPTAAVAPEADLVLRLTDYDFEFSAPVTAGRHLIRVEVETGQPHEVVFVRLEPGKTAMEMAQYALKPQGPPPGTTIGGTSGLAAGQHNLVPITFEPGEYGLICFLPDAADGRPHLLHGMIKQIKVE